MNAIADTVTDFIIQELSVSAKEIDKVRRSHLFESGYVDSLGLVQLIAFIEKTFEVKLSEAQLFSEDFTTIEGIAKLVEEARQSAAPPKRLALVVPPPPVETPPEPAHGVRPVERRDLAQVATIYERVMRSGTDRPPPGLEGAFARQFFDNPHADPALPSLVWEEDGKVEGFIGVHVRRLSFRGAPIRLACAGQFVVLPESRPRGAGARLLRAFLSLPHDLAITDGATPEVLSMWKSLGGWPSPFGNMTWRRTFRPWISAEHRVEGRFPAAHAPLSLLEPAVRVLDGATRAVTGTRFRAPEIASTRREPLTARTMLEGIELLSRTLDVVPRYDAQYVDWLFGQLAAIQSRGVFRAHLVRGSDRSIHGWYLYFLKEGDVSQVLEVAALPGHESTVLRQLFEDADSSGAAAVEGRVEPALIEPLAGLRATLDFAPSRAVMATSNTALAAAIESGNALLTRLAGEHWTALHLEAFESAPNKED